MFSLLNLNHLKCLVADVMWKYGGILKSILNYYVYTTLHKDDNHWVHTELNELYCTLEYRTVIPFLMFSLALILKYVKTA